MATLNYSWALPTVGGSLDTWGTLLNAAFDDVDADLFTVSGVANAALPKAGGTMTGFIVLHADPDAAMKPATKQYVDTADALKLSLAGGTMTGALVAKKASSLPVTDAVSGATVTLDCADGQNFMVPMTANVTTLTISNVADGQDIKVRFTQDATGSRTITWPASFKWVGGSAPVLSTAALAVDLLVASYWADTGHWHCSLMKGLA